MHRLKASLPAFFLAAALFAAMFTDLFLYTENWTQDALYQRPSLVNPDIYVIGIDEKTLSDLGPFDTWSRSGIAQAIDLLSGDPDASPAVIGIDIGYYGEKDGETDRVLSEAAARAGNVVVSAYATFGGEIVETQEGFYARRAVQMLEEPFPALREAAASGFTNVQPDRDGIVRHGFFSLESPDGRRVDSFAAAVCRVLEEDLPSPPLDRAGQWYIPFTGGVHDYFGASLSDLLSGRADAAQFAGSIVLIGPYSAGMMDACYTPVSRNEQMYGVEVHANMIDALLSRRCKRETPPAASLCLTAAVLAVAFLLTRLWDPRMSLAVFSAGSVLYPVGAAAAYGAGWVLPLLGPLAALWSAFLLRVFQSYIAERRERRRLLDLFGRYVSPQVADSIVKAGQSDLLLGGQTRDIAVLFVDIRGFTSLSESMAPEQVVLILNRYFDLTTQAVFDHGGMVDKFIGDATMALFNAPLDADDYAMNAVRAGLAITAGARQLEEDIRERFGRHVALGVGIHCGPAVVGNIGTPFRMDYTAIGDTVNTASRLEGQAGPGEIVISETLYERLKGRIRAQCLGGKVLKGKSGENTVYSVEGLV